MADNESSEEKKASRGQQEEDSPPGGKAKKPRFRDCDEGREFECALCDCKFFTVGQYSVHIQSFEHRKRTIQKVANKAYDHAPQYQGGLERDLPPGLSGRKVVHCKVCNVFTNSAKQLAEHLGGARHKQLCFKFNVPVTTLVLTKGDTHTLEATRLQGEKLMCKHCSVEINSMQQYKEHVNSTKHKLRMENKPLKPDRSIKKALKAFYKSHKKHAKEKEGSDGKKSGEADTRSKDDNNVEGESKGEVKKETEGDKQYSGDSGGNNSSKVRDKYQLNLLDELSELPTLRNEIHYYRAHRPPREKKPPRVKPVPFMCDVCQVFTKSACELNEHLMSEEHRMALKKFLACGKLAMTSCTGDEPLQEFKEDSLKGGQEPKKPELYCVACQLLLPSLGAKREHEKGKKHKFLQELRKGMKTESHNQDTMQDINGKAQARLQETTVKNIHCSPCMVDVESEAAMREHIKSKKHKFLSELKPEPKVVQRPEAAPKRKRPYSSSDQREPAREDIMPELAAVALERQALQVELAKRRGEIDEQRWLIDKLREEQHLEQEKAALRRMIDECRQLIEERERRKHHAAKEQNRMHKARSVQWHTSLEGERDHCHDVSRHNYGSFSKRWNEEIPLLGMPMESEGMYRMSHIGSEESYWETDRGLNAPVPQEPFGCAGGMSTAFSPFQPNANGWPCTSAGLLPDCSSVSREPDWQHPVLCTPPARVGFLGDGPNQLPHLWGHSSAPSPATKALHIWESSATRIPGLDFV